MSNMVYFATSEPGTAKTVLLKNLQRWRADNIRPYTVCATELPSGNSAIQCRNMVHYATLLHHPANTVLLKNLLRWRADDIRPYMACATELPLQKFRRTTHTNAAKFPLNNFMPGLIFYKKPLGFR